MTFKPTNPTAKFSAALATGAMLLLSATTASFAEKAPEAVIDDAAGLYRTCLLAEGSTTNETSTKFSCTTAGGQITTCYKADDPDTACGTLLVEDNERKTRGLFDRFAIIQTAPGNVGMAQTTGSTPRPGKYIMQYSVQNSVQYSVQN